MDSPCPIVVQGRRRDCQDESRLQNVHLICNKVPPYHRHYVRHDNLLYPARLLLADQRFLASMGERICVQPYKRGS